MFEPQSPGSLLGADEIGEVGLEDRRLSPAQALNRRRAGIEPDDRMSTVREASGGHAAEMPKPIDADAHQGVSIADDRDKDNGFG
jgi:hypothetical protein